MSERDPASGRPKGSRNKLGEAEALRGRVIGDGAVYLAIAEAQRKYFAPPVLEPASGSSKRH